jgi:hypothetical protein
MRAGALWRYGRVVRALAFRLRSRKARTSFRRMPERGRFSERHAGLVPRVTGGLYHVLRVARSASDSSQAERPVHQALGMSSGPPRYVPHEPTHAPGPRPPLIIGKDDVCERANLLIGDPVTGVVVSLADPSPHYAIVVTRRLLQESHLFQQLLVRADLDVILARLPDLLVRRVPSGDQRYFGPPRVISLDGRLLSNRSAVSNALIARDMFISEYRSTVPGQTRCSSAPLL